MIIRMRQKVFVNTDPQRRCYNGAFYSFRYDWGPWEDLETVKPEHVEERLHFWRGLNDYAVSQRGESAKTEFKLEQGEIT